ncbi:hypothetical protein FQZ97_1113950 [compost metagenome]
MNIAIWPAESLSLYCSALAAVMVNSGCSSAKGSARKPLASMAPALLGRPPVQAGMLPSALPAFSAPMGVRLEPSCAASSGETLAITLVASRLRASALVVRRVRVAVIGAFLVKVVT